MEDVVDFLRGLFDSSDWPPRWKCGNWTDFHGWIFIIGDLLSWSAFVAIPMVIWHYLQRRKEVQFGIIYVCFALFVLSCGFTHLISAIAFWVPLYRLNALALLTTGIFSWVTIFFLFKILPQAMSLRSQKEFEMEIMQRKKAEEDLRKANQELDRLFAMTTMEVKDYKFALEQSSILLITDEQGRITSVNDNYCEITGYSREELVGGDITSFLVQEEQQPFKREIFQNILKGTSWSGNLFQTSKAGNKLWTAATVVPLSGETENAVRFLFILFDNTEKMVVEKSLLEKSKQMEDVLERITDGFISIDKEMKCLFANTRACEMMEVPPFVTEGLELSTAFPVLDQSNLMKTIKKALVENRYFTHEEYHTKLALWEESHIYPGHDGVFVFIRDITKQKRAEQKIKGSERRFRNLIEHSDDLITLLDKNFQVVYRSPSSERITGKSTQQRKNENNMDQIHPDDQQFLQSQFIKVLAEPKASTNVCFRILHRNDYYIWLEGTVTNMLEEESIEALVLNFRDITQRKEVEERLRESERVYKMIASSIPGSLICIMDKELRYLLLEGDIIPRLGFTKEELQNKRMDEIFPGEVVDHWKIDFEKAFKGELFTKETSANGLDIITKFVPLKNEAGDVYHVMTVSIDITALKSAQREVIDLNTGLELSIETRTKELMEANQELESFSYSVSHDLRAPLRSINGYSKMLEEDYEQIFDTDGLRILRTIQNNAKRMGMLIDDLLSFSRLGRLEIKKSHVNMHELVASILPEALSYGSQNASIQVDDLHSAYADNALIKQVFINYITNALKYSAHNPEPAIHIGSYHEKNEIIYFVRDNGTGFNMGYVHKLFNVFQRLHNSKDFEGTGVGLAIVKRIVEKHGGRVWAEGKEKEGATFYFSLPDSEY